jgi:hypothetical protein
VYAIGAQNFIRAISYFRCIRDCKIDFHAVVCSSQTHYLGVIGLSWDLCFLNETDSNIPLLKNKNKKQIAIQNLNSFDS